MTVAERFIDDLLEEKSAKKIKELAKKLNMTDEDILVKALSLYKYIVEVKDQKGNVKIERKDGSQYYLDEKWLGL